MYIAVICSPMRSHLGQMIVALRRLRQGGHRVELWGCSFAEETARRFEFGFRRLPTGADIEEAAGKLLDPSDYYTRFSFPMTARQLPEVLRYCREDPPDLLHSNVRIYTAAAASLVTGIPASNHSPSGLSFGVVPEDLYGFCASGGESERKRELMVSLARGFHREMDGAFQQLVAGPFGLPPVTNAVGLASTSCVLVLSIKELANARLARLRYVHFTGPLIDDAPSAPAKDDRFEKYCYVTLGTWPLPRDETLRIYREIVAGVPATYRVVLGLGGRFLPEELGLKDARVTAYEYARQAALVRRAEFVVCHGGCQTVNESLYFGKPILAIAPPVTEPREMVHKAREAGVCVEIAPKDVSALAVRGAVDELTLNGRYRRNAEDLGRRFREAGGAETAVRMLEQAGADRGERG